MLLSEMKEGDRCRITRVWGIGPFRRRVQEMGLLTGTEVFIEKYAPLKDPVELIVKGYHVSLRVAEAARVDVEKI